MRIAGRDVTLPRRVIPPIPPTDLPPLPVAEDPDVEASATPRGRLRSVTAAVQRFIGIRRRSDRSRHSSRTGWQAEAWDRFDDTPEVRFAANWIGNAMSRAKLRAGFVNDAGDIEDLPEGHPAIDIVARIAGGPDGQAQMLKQFGPHLVVAGEGWIIIEPATAENTDSTADDDLDWHVLSVEEIKPENSRLVATIDDREVVVPDGDSATETDPLALRVWDPSPRRHIEPDSPIRSSLGILDELRLLNASVKAIARSRLVGRGVFVIPQGARFPTTPGADGGDAEDDLLDVFMTVAETAYRDPESAAATLPILMEVPKDVAKDLQHITFESEFDEIAIKLREEAIRRFATGLDTPAEILLGMGGVNHWGVWSLTEEAIRLAVEPRLSLVADALTRQWVRPILQSEDHLDAGRIIVYADTAPLRVRSNRAQTAVEVQKIGGISLEALRRETGFDDDDAPSDAELTRMLLERLLVANPSYARWLLPLLGIELPEGWDLDTPPAEDDPPAEQELPSDTDLPADENQGAPANEPAGNEQEQPA